VTTSAWISFGTFPIQQAFQVILTDTTGEAQASHTVVVDAVRFTLVAGAN
jgi:hypothetical protein